jgi:antitoxin PrlF
MKRRYRTKITRKGQITLPAEVRRLMNLKIGDEVDVIVEDNRIVGIEPASDWVTRTAGIFKSDAPPLSERELKATSEQAIVDSVMERARRTADALERETAFAEERSEYESS